LREAEALASIGLWDGALTRAYYAGYHAACALLLTEGLEARTHDGVRSLFGERFVKAGRLPADAAATLADLKRYREAADYRRGFEATEDLARRHVAAARRFCEALRSVLAAGGWLPMP
jgi:uncharacterized protein (UPF0332 family)